MSSDTKPELLVMGSGAHNEALMEGKLDNAFSYKRSRVVYVIPAIGAIPPKVYLSHRSLIFPPNQAMLPMLVHGAEVGDAYERALTAILGDPNLREWEFILTLESDNCPQPDAVLKLLAAMEKHPEYSVISGLYWCKGVGGPNGMGVPHLWGDITDSQVNYRPVKPRPGEIIEVYGTSMGAALWRMSMFRDPRIPRPLFKTKADLNGVGTQDLAAANELHKLGYRFAVDCSVLVGHYDYEGKFGPPDMMW